MIFVLNCGSSSIKYQLVDLDTGESVVSGLVERVTDYEAGVQDALATVGDRTITAVGHRVVHGGAEFRDATVITDEVERRIDALSTLAPLHNPPNVSGVRAARLALPDVPHVAVFDTAFHQSLHPEAFTYAIDAGLAAEYGVRRYGFHGTSHKFVSEAAAHFLDRDISAMKIIVLHLGNGASITAVNGGLSRETSMGMTPVEGLVMGTRSGDIDAGALVHLHREAGLDVDDLDDLLNRRSGMLGLAGTGDMRDVIAAATDGDASARLALDVYCHRIRGYVGAYIAQLGGIDAIVFTGGVGENSAMIRERTLVMLEFIGIAIDAKRNRATSGETRFVSPEGAPVAVLVIPTNEELEIARQTAAAVGG